MLALFLFGWWFSLSPFCRIAQSAALRPETQSFALRNPIRVNPLRVNRIRVNPNGGNPTWGNPVDTHVRLEPDETGLAEASEAQAENISTVRKESLAPSRSRLRVVSATRLGQIARCVVLAMGILSGGLPGNSA